MQDSEGVVPLGFGIAFDKQGCLDDVRRKTRRCCLVSLGQLLIAATVFFAVGYELKHQGGYQLWQCGLMGLLASVVGLLVIDTGLVVLSILPGELRYARHPLTKKPGEGLSAAYFLTCLWGVALGGALGSYATNWLWSAGYLLSVTAFSWFLIYLAAEWKLDKLPSCLGCFSLALLPLACWHFSSAPYPHWWIGGLLALAWSELCRQAVLMAFRHKLTAVVPERPSAEHPSATESESAEQLKGPVTES